MPQLDILSFPSQIFWLCVVFLFGLVISLKYILPSAAATIHGRKFFSEAKYRSSKSDKGFEIVNGYVTRLNASLDQFLQIDFKDIENKTQEFISVFQTKQKNAEKFFLSPFFFFYVTDTGVLLIAFFISFTGLFLYLYYNLPLFQKSSYLDLLNNFRSARSQFPPKRLATIRKLFY